MLLHESICGLHDVYETDYSAKQAQLTFSHSYSTRGSKGCQVCSAMSNP